LIGEICATLGSGLKSNVPSAFWLKTPLASSVA